MTDDQPPLRSGTLARLAGVSTDTLRYYERRGLLPRPPRDASGYRRYPQAAAVRVRVIQQALDAGFTVEDLARALKQRDAGGAPCSEWEQRLAVTPAGRRAGLLDGLAAAPTDTRLRLLR
jgi:DNA-binding transcriptional MerR regulator